MNETAHILKPEYACNYVFVGLAIDNLQYAIFTLRSMKSSCFHFSWVGANLHILFLGFKNWFGIGENLRLNDTCLS